MPVFPYASTIGGAQGPAGPSGASGAPRVGATGATGVTGPVGPAGPTGPGATTFNPSDVAADTTLSGGNLVATNVPASTGGARATHGHSTGLWCFETTLTSRGTGGATNNVSTGLAILASSYPNVIVAPTEAILLYFSGPIYNNGVEVLSSGPPFSQGTTILHAVDFTHGNIWFTVDGTHWNSTSSITNSPLANTGGLSFTNLSSSTLYPIVGMDGTITNCIWTANFGGSPFVHAVAVAALVAGGYTAGW